MKKFLTFLLVFFWSMIYPSLSFNSFTTDIIDNSVQYSDLFDENSRNEIIKSARFEFWIF